MDSGQILSWIITAVGLTGFHFAGKKAWWSWYINLGCQALWLAYAIVTLTPAFALSALFYTYVFGRNAHLWTQEHNSKKKEVSGNLSKNRNDRRSPVHWRLSKWSRARSMGKHPRADDRDSC